MMALDLDVSALQKLEAFYDRRVQQLKTVQLKDLLRQKAHYLFLLNRAPRVCTMVEDLLVSHLASSETEWQQQIDNPTFCLQILHLIQDYPTEYRLQFEKEWAKAVNRCEFEFLNEFATAEGGIDWEKLVHFNSGVQPTRVPRKQKA